MRTARAAAVLLAASLLAGCSGGPGRDDAAAPSAAPTPSPTPTSGSTAPSPSGPTAGLPSAPATTAGSLSIGSFPTPEQLGPGWRYTVDPGDAEGGYTGNGTPGLARDPAEVAALAVPLGCRRPAGMPRPRHAFEVDYAARGTAVIGLRMEFGSAAEAARFAAARTAALRGCRGRDGGPGVGVLVRTVRTSVDGVAGAVLSDRSPATDGWTELGLHAGTDVLLYAAQAPLGRDPLSRTGARIFQRQLAASVTMDR